MKPVVYVTQKEYDKAEEIFRSNKDFKSIPTSSKEDKLANNIKEKSAFGVIVGVDNYKHSLYSSLPEGGIIARFGVGNDGVDKTKATDGGIIVTNTPGVLDDSVAEHTIGLIVSLARQIPLHDTNMKSLKWSPSTGMELKGKRLLILGFGAIGRKTAKIASMGFGMNVTAFDVAEFNSEQMKKDFGISMITDNLDKVIGQADFISIHLPSILETRHFINTELLSKIKQGARIINTARGAVLDESALYDALSAGHIAAAALDVFEKEPYEPANSAKDLRTLDKVILTPHVSSSTKEACQRMALSCLENIKAAYEKNYNNLDILNPEVLKTL